MIKRTMLLIILFNLLFLMQPYADAMAGAGCQYLFTGASVVPEVRIRGAGDFYAKLSDEFTLFGNGQLFAVYTPPTALLDAILDTAADLSYLHDAWLLRWGIQSGLAYTSGAIYPLLDLGSHLLFSYGSDTFTFKLLPQIFYHTVGRTLLDLPVQLSFVLTLFEQVILAPQITGGWVWIREGNGEPYYAIACELDWYPGAPFTLNWIIGYQEFYSDNDYAINDALTIPDYYGYREIYCNLVLDLLAGSAFSMQLRCPCSFKLMKHNAVLLPQLGTEQEWQFSVKPELKLDYAFTDHFSLLFALGLVEVRSNTPYMEIGYVQAGLEVIYNF